MMASLTDPEYEVCDACEVSLYPTPPVHSNHLIDLFIAAHEHELEEWDDSDLNYPPYGAHHGT